MNIITNIRVSINRCLACGTSYKRNTCECRTLTLSCTLSATWFTKRVKAFSAETFVTAFGVLTLLGTCAIDFTLVYVCDKRKDIQWNNTKNNAIVMVKCTLYMYT